MIMKSCCLICQKMRVREARLKTKVKRVREHLRIMRLNGQDVFESPYLQDIEER